jgi:hypothetical protein
MRKGMYMTALTLLAVLIICIVEGIPLIKAEMKKELITVVIISLVGLVIEINSNLAMITPIGLIQKVFEPIGRMFLTNL